MSSRISSLVVAVALVGGATAVAGCASQPPGSIRASESSLATELRECGLLGAGAVGATTLSAFYFPDDCYDDCLAEASCEQLEDALCRRSIDLLVRCDERCAFRCEDGGLIGPDRVCDGAQQCMGGEDEQGCAFPLMCRNGDRVPGARCDGSWNCPDGSDEEGCAAVQCDGGRRNVSPWERCDGYLNCADGEDELGCPSHVCADGRLITFRPGTPDPVCNGWTQCGDGSDERGCAQLTTTCD